MARVPARAPRFLPSRAFLVAALWGGLLRRAEARGIRLADDVYEIARELVEVSADLGRILSVSFEVGLDQGFPSTAETVAALIRHGEAVGYDARTYQPAAVDLVAELSAVPTTTATLIGAGKAFTTEPDDEGSVVVFEVATAVAGYDMNTTSAASYDESAGTTTDVGADLTSAAGSTASLLPASPAIGDAFLLTFPDPLVADRVDFDLTTAAAGLTLRWATWNGYAWRRTPRSITDLGASVLQVDFAIPSGFGDLEDLEARLYLRSTGAYQTATITQPTPGVYRVTTTAAPPAAGEAGGYLGQSTPSTTATDYELGFAWFPLLNETDGTSGLTVDGALTFDLPEEHPDQPGVRWELGGPTGWPSHRLLAAVVVAVSSPTVPVAESADWTQGTAFVFFDASQGSTVDQQSIGTTTGSEFESFTFADDERPFEGATIYVDEGAGPAEWIDVASFLNSRSTDDHVRVTRAPNARGGLRVEFGDGDTGRIPTASSDVFATYKIGGEIDGNVAANTVTRNADGVSAIEAVWNPVGAYGWLEAEGASRASLEALRRAVLQQPRIPTYPITRTDFEAFAEAWIDPETGTRPVSRAWCFEVAGGDAKAVRLVVVGGGGVVLSSEVRGRLLDYFNVPDGGITVVNSRVAAVDAHTVRAVSVSYSITGDYTAADAAIAAQIVAYLTGDADVLDGEGVSTGYKRFHPGENVTPNKLDDWLYDRFPELRRSGIELVRSAPSASITLGPTELPGPGGIVVNGVTYY